MKVTLQIQLLPDRGQAALMRATIERFNRAANWLADRAFDLRTANKVLLQKLYYGELREQFGLSAQMAVRCIAQTCDAYSRDRRVCPRFYKYSSMPLDQRLMSFKGLGLVSLLTLSGRVLVPIIVGCYRPEGFTSAKGRSELVLREDGKWFLLASVDLPDEAPLPATDFIGVDLSVYKVSSVERW